MVGVPLEDQLDLFAHRIVLGHRVAIDVMIVDVDVDHLLQVFGRIFEHKLELITLFRQQLQRRRLLEAFAIVLGCVWCTSVCVNDIKLCAPRVLLP